MRTEWAIGSDGNGRATAAPERQGSRLLDALWQRRSVRAQLLITIILIDLIAALVAGGVIILKTRTSVRVEVAASMELAALLVRETIQMQQAAPAEQFLSNLPLQLRFLRHVRILAVDLAGHPVATQPTADGADVSKGEDRSPAPAWFAALVASPIERHEIPVVVKDQRIGSVLVVGEPRDEIAEAWENTVALGTVAFVLSIAVIGMLYVLFGRVLGPLAALADGLSDLEHQNYKVRLPQPQARELATITGRFNALAEALAATRAENQELNHRLITAQDDERRRTALDLHDEVGPSLFGLKAIANSIAIAVGELKGAAGDNARERVGELLAIIEHLQVTNRSLLNRLRPMALGHVPLRDILSELVRDRARQHPQIAFSFAAETLMPSYGDSIDLTIYRCVQESLTNAIRHAQAKNVGVDLGETVNEMDEHDGAAASQLKLAVQDDGQGIDPSMPKGFGILGMQQRVQALGGHYAVESGAGRGTCVRIAIPVPPGGPS